VTGPAEEVGLERHDEATPPEGLARGCDGGVDLARMVGVVVHDVDAVRLSEALKPASDAAEGRQSPCDVRPVAAEGTSHRDGRQGVDRVVTSGHRKLDRTERL